MTAHPRWKVDLPGRAATTLRVLARTRVPILVWRAVATREPGDRLDAQQRPQLLARPECPIIVLLDGSPFAERALEVAETLARTFDLSLVLTRAIELATHQEVERKEERVATDYLQRVRRAVERRGVRHAVIAPRHGTPLRVIDRVWHDFDAGLIVLASHGRTGPAGPFLGSTAAHLIEEVEAPVLVIRPELEKERFLREHLTPSPVSPGAV